MSRKLLMVNHVLKTSIVKNRYETQYEGYPISIIDDERLNGSALTYVNEISGNENNHYDEIEIIGDLQDDGTYKIDIISCDNQFCFGRGGRIE
jgi:hypothetical protein